MGYGVVPSQAMLGNADGLFFENYEMAHFRLLSDVNFLPYGRSYLEPGRKIFKQYVLMEDAMLIHRIVRAPEKRIFYVNVGSIPPNEVENYMQKMINKMKKVPYIDPQTGQYNLKYNMQNTLEDFYIPVRGNDSTTRIDTTKGLEYNGIDDVNYLKDKLFAALKIPKAFLGYEKDLTGKATLAAEDIRFARTVERIQRIILSELYKIAIVHLYVQGYEGESLTNFELNLTTPSIIYDQERMALLAQKVDLAGNMIDKELMPTSWIYEHLFHMSEEQMDDLRDQLVEDKKTKFRLDQIQTEGNDPYDSGQAYGTPSQLATAYGTGRYNANGEVPVGFDETNPNEPKPLQGRPTERPSFIGTQNDPLGKDRLGNKFMKSNDDQEDGTLRASYKGNSPLALEAKSTLAGLRSALTNAPKANRKITLFEQSDMLNEDNIREQLD
jgi:hypothetical protein